MKAHLSLTLTLPQPLTVVSLVPGGWFPLNMTSARVHLIDRNVMIWFRKQTEGAKAQPRYEANRWWFEFLNDPRQSINPVFCALEARGDRLPTRDEFAHEYRAACDIVQNYLPRARVIWHTDDHFDALFDVVRSLSRAHEKQSTFLRTVAPNLVNRVKPELRAALTERILDHAQSCGVTDALVLAAALSCVYEGPGSTERSAAKRIIKPKKSYSQADAHNALMDLTFLNLFSIGTMFGTPQLGLCTRDRALAAFWGQLNVQQSTWSNERYTVQYSPKPTMFPALSPVEVNTLLDHLHRKGFLGGAGNLHVHH